MCLCKDHLHARRAISALVKLCQKQDIDISFSYATFFHHLQLDCPPSDSAAYLSWNCTTDKKTICTHQRNIWNTLKQEITAKVNADICTNFQYFDKQEIEKKGIIKNRLVARSKSVNLCFIIEFIDNMLTKIIHHRNLLSNFRSVYPMVSQSISSIEVCVEFSENLTLTLPEEIQSMYWGAGKNRSHSTLRNY